jgi:hypothetical protein
MANLWKANGCLQLSNNMIFALGLSITLTHSCVMQSNIVHKGFLYAWLVLPFHASCSVPFFAMNLFICVVPLNNNLKNYLLFKIKYYKIIILKKKLK